MEILCVSNLGSMCFLHGLIQLVDVCVGFDTFSMVVRSFIGDVLHTIHITKWLFQVQNIELDMYVKIKGCWLLHMSKMKTSTLHPFNTISNLGGFAWRMQFSEDAICFMHEFFPKDVSFLACHFNLLWDVCDY